MIAFNVPKLVVVPIGFAFVIAVIVMVVDYHVGRRLIVTTVQQSDQPILCPMVKVPINHSMSLNACLNDVVADHLMHVLNVAFDEHLHDELPMVHRIYSVKEKTMQ